jgi:hypothetical protein
MLEQESEELRLNPEFKLLLEPFVAKTPNRVSAGSLSA